MLILLIRLIYKLYNHLCSNMYLSVCSMCSASVPRVGLGLAVLTFSSALLGLPIYHNMGSKPFCRCSTILKSFQFQNIFFSKLPTFDKVVCKPKTSSTIDLTYLQINATSKTFRHYCVPSCTKANHNIKVLPEYI